MWSLRSTEAKKLDAITPVVCSIATGAMLFPSFQSTAIMLTMGTGYNIWIAVFAIAWIVLAIGILNRTTANNKWADFSFNMEYVGTVSVAVNLMVYALMLAYVYPGTVASFLLGLVVSLAIKYLYIWYAMNKAISYAKKKDGAGEHQE